MHCSDKTAFAEPSTTICAERWQRSGGLQCPYTAVSTVVGKSARDNPERYCGWLLGHWFSKKFQRMAQEATDMFASAKGKQQKQVRQLQCQEQVS